MNRRGNTASDLLREGADAMASEGGFNDLDTMARTSATSTGGYTLTHA
jgi:hypothetical protein